jgi:hypothetical protein
MEGRSYSDNTSNNTARKLYKQLTIKGGVTASFIETSFPQTTVYLYKYRR